jgi:ornithine cyclodeaminase/alanine dehydrogenase
LTHVAELPPIRYLSQAEVERLLPSGRQQVDLVRAAFGQLADGWADAPAAPEIEPRPGAFMHAMPAYLPEQDISAVKWIGGYPENREHGLPYLSGVIVVNQGDTGVVSAIMDCAAVTAARTAAVSAACIERFAAAWSTVAIVGFGVQAETHVRLLRELNPAAEFRAYTRSPSAAATEGAAFFDSARAVVEGSDIVITGVPLHGSLDPPVHYDWLATRALVLPLDDDVSLDPSVVNRAAGFYVDDLEDFEMRRGMGRFQQWRSPDDTVPSMIGDSAACRASGVVVCANQGMGLIDAVFAAHVLQTADREQVGRLLPR